MKKTIIILAVIAVALSMGPSAHAQMSKGQINVGPRLGYWWSGIGFGVSGEYIIMNIANIGFLGAGAEIGYSSESYDYGWWGVKYTYIPLVAFASFHYPIPNVPKLVPFVRAGFGIFITSASETGDWHGVDWDTKNTYFDIIFQPGIRYQLAPMIWLSASTGWPYYISVGIDFCFGGK